MLAANNFAGEKQREHPHYLKGTIYCGQCGSRLIVCHAKGRSGIYPYFICIGRQHEAQRLQRSEPSASSAPRSPSPPTTPPSSSHPRRGRAPYGPSCATSWPSSAPKPTRERTTQQQRLRNLEYERKKLLDAHYAEAIPLDLLKSEQDRLTSRDHPAPKAACLRSTPTSTTAEANLERALTRAGDCEAAYREATPKMRRQFNLAFFTRLLIWRRLHGHGRAQRALRHPARRRSTPSRLGSRRRGATPRRHRPRSRGADRRHQASRAAARHRGPRGTRRAAPTRADAGPRGRRGTPDPFISWRF